MLLWPCLPPELLAELLAQVSGLPPSNQRIGVQLLAGQLAGLDARRLMSDAAESSPTSLARRSGQRFHGGSSGTGASRLNPRTVPGFNRALAARVNAGSRMVHGGLIGISGDAPDGLVFDMGVGRFASGDVKLR